MDPNSFTKAEDVWEFDVSKVEQKELKYNFNEYKEKWGQFKKLKLELGEVNRILPTECMKYFGQNPEPQPKKPSAGAIAGIIITIVAVVGILGAGVVGLIPGVLGSILPI